MKDLNTQEINLSEMDIVVEVTDVAGGPKNDDVNESFELWTHTS
ncbi:hypothetical protein [Pseudoalteromonas ruthenica]|nr:hypothetical protein [Pseudoalteromonas ruthenica]